MTNRTKALTGNPYIALNVRKAKELKKNIIEVSETVAGDLPVDVVGFSAHDDSDECTRPAQNSVASEDLVSNLERKN